MNGAIILAAGQGTRYHGKKQDLIFHGKPLWRYAYETTLSVVGKDNIVAVGKDMHGGQTRSWSVRIGLEALPKCVDRVILVEAARPMVTNEQIIQLLEDSYPSSTFVRPLVNTVIFRNGTYVNRNEMYDMLTPQAFDRNMLQKAYESGRFEDMTDETRVMFEYYGVKPHFVETESNLFKITYPGDLDILESIYRTRFGKE
ncbi:MAG: 2-C-methyl-D-erythritol 4-phosphate cytidylyltransferase [Bacteroidales bacterium]|nr:2-C-methyl-D-erythritol 4-phosphate cytidylyltransferase [Bacteroidales bacterium]